MRREKRWVLALVLSLVVAVIGAVAVGCGKAKKYTFNYNSMGGGAVAAAEYTVGDTKFYFPTPAQGDKATSMDSGSSAGTTTRLARTIKPPTQRISM